MQNSRRRKHTTATLNYDIYNEYIHLFIMEEDTMAKRGRPKKVTTTKDRRKIVQLDAEANFILKQVKKRRLNFNFSQYVSEHIKKDFSQSIRDKEQWLRMLAAEKTKELDKVNSDIEQISEQIRELQSQREARIQATIQRCEQ